MLLIVLVLMQYVYYCVHCTKWTFYFLKLRTLRVFLLIVLVEEYGVLVLLEGKMEKRFMLFQICIHTLVCLLFM